ncbi:type II restriction endonuclease [Planctomyces sp. SH-PL14]|uniref:type II restriction endonuclease n=1 Tax=Planctomyces sp. SH-PL14 TaxID=1632864 RepID=UPI00078BB6E0|nr:type II restriction endonuclease [Planctomyces sp. SH-PL14]AMV17420.1 Type-2 restriction enzyme EcoRII [Planctomyces sp. SH-PL14]
MADLTDWMDENSGPHIVWYVKRLAANDTLANESHQAGPYIPKEFFLGVFPSLNRPRDKNPDKKVELTIDSHCDARPVRAVWYNNKTSEPDAPGAKKKSKRDECRLTRFGGARSALLDPESTGSLAVFAFYRGETGESEVCHVWVCDTEVEADLVEDRVGPVEPGKLTVWTVDENDPLLPKRSRPQNSCWLEPEEFPSGWLSVFPTGAEIIRKTVELRSGHGLPVDSRLLKRRRCEYELFQSLEEATELPIIRNGFDNIEDFLARAQHILQRRKSRAGLSLELQTREIFLEENLLQGTDFDHQPESEPGKHPDFLFPSKSHYSDPAFPASRLRMLAAKTTCKDRWSQVLTEAQRIPEKHLLTLQEGMSVRQFTNMTEAGIRLVVPTPIIGKFPSQVRPHLQSLESFIADVRLLRVN